MAEKLAGRVIIGLVAALACLLDTSMALSQEDICTPDCLEIGWSAEKSILVSMAPQYPDCDIEVKYVERESCNGGTKHDFQLTGAYSFRSDSSCRDVRTALSADGPAAITMLRLIHEKAMNALITDHVLALAAGPECGRGTQITYRAFHGRCFLRRSMQETPTTNGVYVSYVTERCGNICCTWLFGACYNTSSREVEIKLLSSPGSGPICPFSRFVPTEQCHGLCFDA